jgi:mannose-6-phosphate isomerase-like protein (cupin superfamily)
MSMPAPPSEDTISLGGDELSFRLTSERSGGMLIAFEVRIPPGGGPPMLHRHDPFELYRIEAGELTFHVEGEVRTDGPGAVVAIPGGSEHTIRNESDVEARAFVVMAPGAAMEHFFREAAVVGASGEAAMADVLALASAHGIEMTRPVEETA